MIEKFLLSFLRDFYTKIIETNDFNNFEKILSEWIIYEIENEKKAMELYLLIIDNKQDSKKDFKKLYLIEEINDSFNSLRNKIIIIGKYLLSLFYYKDIILDFNYKHNFITLQKLADNDDLEAQCNLAFCYQNGHGVKEDEYFEEELELAITGNLMSQNYVGYCYQNGIGINKNEKKAFKWYFKSAENGFAEAQCNLGFCYEKGIGIVKDEIKSFECKALELYVKSAIAGVSAAQCDLGFCYTNGIGTDKNEIKSFEWYLRSAEGGYALAQHFVGNCYYHGDFGINNVSNSNAIYWYKKAANNGIKEAKDKLDFLFSF
ncbi:hypothetical protein C1645_821930 [Glomus cerebriforme]|uniref:Uncharacterized protein n=1 Tax=Glomus cerebriforme TaxID=658196 RepID=A0A397SZ72_9GLOM|nr:hypothetical protein C1645_821930 [Glomus cerebriforme]